MQTHILRMVADRVDIGWPQPANIRFNKGTIVLSFENVSDVRLWLEAFACAQVEDKSFANLKSRYTILSYAGDWLSHRVLIVQCSKERLRETVR